MAKVATYDGNVLIYGSKVQIDCACTCQTPEYRNMFPYDNEEVYLPPTGSANFKTQGEVRYCDTIKLYVSTDDQASFDHVGTSGVGGWNAFSLATGLGTTPTYSGAWSGYWQMNPVSPVDSSNLVEYSPVQTVWWYWLLENDCGAATAQTTPRRYRFLNEDNPPPVIDCLGCGRQLKDSYVVNVTGTDGSYDFWRTLSPFTMTHDGGSNCNWRYSTPGSPPYALLTWSVSRWIITFTHNGTCWFRVFGPTASCDPRGTYVAGAAGGGTCDAAGCSGGTTCPGAYTAVVT